MEIFTVFLEFQLLLFSLGQEGKPGCCFRGSVNCFSWLCVMWGFDVIQRDGVRGGADVTAAIRFLLHSITYNVPHAAVSLAGNRNKSACPGTEKCGGDGGAWLVGEQALETSHFRNNCVTKELAPTKG